MLPHKTIIVVTVVVIISSISQTQSPKDLDKPYKLLYRNLNKGEMDLEICTKSQPCNVINNPFFYPFTVRRICRCETKNCPDTFDIIKNNYTVFVYNRQQLKFCEDQPLCMKDSSILKVSTKENIPLYLSCIQPSRRYYWKQVLDPIQNSEDQLVELDRKDVHQNTYISEQRKICKTSSCGYLREDLYATYQFCDCRYGSLCLPTLNVMAISEALYKGIGYSSACTKWN